MVSVNLLPAGLVRGQARRRRSRRWVVACLLSGLVAGVPVGLESYRMARAEELRRTSVRLSGETEAVEAELGTMLVASQEAYLQIERAKALRAKRSWSSMLALLGDAMPRGCWLTELATDPAHPVGGARPVRRAPATPSDAQATTVVIDAPRTLRIKGFASDPAEPLLFLDSLKATGVFADVVSLGTQREPWGDDFYFRFELECTW